MLSKTNTPFILSEGMLSKYHKKGIGNCGKKSCSQTLHVGDKVISSNAKTHKKVYHKKCWESLFI